MSVYRREDGTVDVGVSVDSVEAAGALSIVVRLSLQLDRGMIEKFVSEFRLMETTLPIFNPTEYRRSGERVDANRRIGEAWLRFRDVLDEEARKLEPMMRTRTVHMDGMPPMVVADEEGE